jgi:hypothetical protein
MPSLLEFSEAERTAAHDVLGHPSLAPSSFRQP